MPAPDWPELHERLLRAGVAPHHSRRMVEELQTHLESLIEKSSASGLTHVAAMEQASRRLGSLDQLAAAAAAQPMLRSLGARWPLVIYLLAPVAVAAFTCAAPMLLTVAMISCGSAPIGNAQLPLTERIALIAARDTVPYVAPLFWAVAFAEYSLRRRSMPAWPALAGASVATLAGCLNLRLVWPSPHLPGEIRMGIGFPPGGDGLSQFLTRCALVFSLAIAWYAWRRSRLRALRDGLIAKQPAGLK